MSYFVYFWCRIFQVLQGLPFTSSGHATVNRIILLCSWMLFSNANLNSEHPVSSFKSQKCLLCSCFLLPYGFCTQKWLFCYNASISVSSATYISLYIPSYFSKIFNISDFQYTATMLSLFDFLSIYVSLNSSTSQETIFT